MAYNWQSSSDRSTEPTPRFVGDVQEVWSCDASLVGKPSSGSRLIGAGCSRVYEGTRQGLGKSTSIHS